MQFTESTPRKEITISEVVLRVISPYTEGHVLSVEEANVLNQTLAENLRNNFAPRVKEVKEAAGGVQNVDIYALQAELDNYIAEYSFGIRRTSGTPAVDPVTKLAISLAKDSVKKALAAAGKNPKDFSAEQITELARGAVERTARFRELAEEQLKIKRAAASEELAGLLG